MTKHPPVYEIFYQNERGITVRRYPGSMGYRVYQGENFLSFFIHLDQAIGLAQKH